MSQRPTISLCMIVRDEEPVLARCLASARGAVDEICVVDTGSTDRTVEIAERFGARVSPFEWNDSFAAARNVSLSMATSDWVLVLDADEVLRPGAAKELQRIAADPGLAGAFLRFDHLMGETRQQGWLLRFFRRGAEARFEGAIHEQLAPEFERSARERGQRLLLSKVEVEHDGYLEEVSAAKQKIERNRSIFERAVADEPDNVFLRFKYADFLRGEGARAAAIEQFEVVCERLLDYPTDAPPFAFHAEAFALLALERLEAGQPDEAGRRLEQALGRFVPTVHFHFVRGLWLLREARFEEALRAFVDGRGRAGEPTVQVPAPGVLTWRTSLGMAEALEGLNRRSEAEELLSLEARRSVGVAAVWLAFASLLERMGRLREALEACMAGLRKCPASAALWSLCARLLLDGGASAEAAQAAEKALACAPPAERADALELVERCQAAA